MKIKCMIISSMRGDEAKQVCPQIQLVKVPVARGKADLNTYRNAGSEVSRFKTLLITLYLFLSLYSLRVELMVVVFFSFSNFQVVSVLARKGRCERASIDEVYLDLTDAAETMLAENPPESLEVIDEEAVKSHILGLNNEVRDSALRSPDHLYFYQC